MKWKRVLLATITAATLSLASVPAGARCDGDLDGNNRVTVAELITAVRSALAGCETPLSILGRYEGRGFESLMGCMDPGDDGTSELQEITLEVSEQNGSLYDGTLSLVTAKGAALSLEIEGSVDSEGFTQGSGFLPGVPVPAGIFTGRLVGNILTISVRVGNPGCESDAASFIGTRN